jgi:hypothetical protein
MLPRGRAGGNSGNVACAQMVSRSEERAAELEKQLRAAKEARDRAEEEASCAVGRVRVLEEALLAAQLLRADEAESRAAASTAATCSERTLRAEVVALGEAVAAEGREAEALRMVCPDLAVFDLSFPFQEWLMSGLAGDRRCAPPNKSVGSRRGWWQRCGR